MTLTFLDLYNECAGQPWSMFDNDALSTDDFESAMKASINKAVSFLWNYQPWAFRVSKKTIRTKSGTSEYSMPNGLLTTKTIDSIERYGIKYDGKYLTYEPSFELLDEKTGAPEYFYIDGDKLYIYPTPDASYEINITYLKLAIGYKEDGTEIYEMEDDDDYLNVPEKYEKIFKNCLISLAMIYAIADESDENHSGYLKQYEDALSILLKYCKTGVINRNIVW